MKIVLETLLYGKDVLESKNIFLHTKGSKMDLMTHAALHLCN